jgi:hypothetical protein
VYWFCAAPTAKAVVAIARGAVAALVVTEDFGDTTSENAAEIEAALESLAVITKEETPATAGVPAIVPVDEFNVKPVGKCPLVELHL